MKILKTLMAALILGVITIPIGTAISNASGVGNFTLQYSWSFVSHGDTDWPWIVDETTCHVGENWSADVGGQGTYWYGAGFYRWASTDQWRIDRNWFVWNTSNLTEEPIEAYVHIKVAKKSHPIGAPDLWIVGMPLEPGEDVENMDTNDWDSVHHDGSHKYWSLPDAVDHYMTVPISFDNVTEGEFVDIPLTEYGIDQISLSGFTTIIWRCVNDFTGEEPDEEADWDGLNVITFLGDSSAELRCVGEGEAPDPPAGGQGAGYTTSDNVTDQIEQYLGTWNTDAGHWIVMIIMWVLLMLLAAKYQFRQGVVVSAILVFGFGLALKWIPIWTLVIMAIGFGFYLWRSIAGVARSSGSE